MEPRRKMKTNIRIGAAFLVMVALHAMKCGKNDLPHYRGKPFSDSNYHAGPQTIPGNVQCEYYDFGGEGVAYHDADSTNSGSGGLNPSDGSYLNEFRKNEGVDISYTKMDERKIDNNPYNLVEPEKNQFYVGWTEPGEWMKYTVRVKNSGLYAVGLRYTSNRGGKISLSVDDQDPVGPIDVASTFAKEDPLNWRQWHHWNHVNGLAEIRLQKGIHVLTLATVGEGNMNYDYLEFIFKK
jgi:hypothetical protein